nr:hypothetical protein [Tanacetum cinerariifolium]
MEEQLAREDQRMDEQIARDFEIARIHAEEELQIMIDGLDRNNETKQHKEFDMSILKSHSGWKTKLFKGMSLEEIREKFIPVWKQIKDFVPMGSKEEGERFKRKGLRSTRLQTVQDKEMIEGILSKSAFDSGNLIVDEALSLGKDCWE